MFQNTIEKKRATHFPISSIDDQISITATFSITLEGEFPPMQLIYKGKTTISLPKAKFPEEFSLSVNESHYSNEKETFKLLKLIILPSIKRMPGSLGLSKECEAVLVYGLGLSVTQKTILIYLKSLYAKWLIDFYDFMSTMEGKSCN